MEFYRSFRGQVKAAGRLRIRGPVVHGLQGETVFVMRNTLNWLYPMDTRSFLSLLTQHPQHLLRFSPSPGHWVAMGYHLTEVMAVSYQTMDCGGVANAWNETIFQLEDPRSPDDTQPMTAAKFLRIYQQVEAAVTIDPLSQARVEYGPADAPAIRYLIDQVRIEEGCLEVFLEASRVTCKARDRRQTASELELLPMVAQSTCC